VFLGRRLRQLANEREKLLRAYYSDAIDVAILKREQARINAEAADAESQIASDGEKLAQAKQIIGLALDLAKDRAASYRKARPDVRKMWNRAIFQTIRVRDGAIADFAYEEPLCLTPRCTHKGSMVDPRSSFVRFEADAERAVADITHWTLADGTEVDIVNFLDDHSRLAVASRVVGSATAPGGPRGVPRGRHTVGCSAAVLTDNGCIYTTWHGRAQRHADRVARARDRLPHSRPYHPRPAAR
jgi:hypothetical protein